MTVNYRRSVNGSNDQLGRKYLSDSLTPYWGAWRSSGGVQTIAYDTLPIGDALARINTSNMASGDVVCFDFGGNIADVGKQNIRDFALEFFYKCGSNVPAVGFYLITGRWGLDATAAFVTITLNVGGAAPTVWTYRKITLSDFVSVTPPSISRYYLMQSMKEITWYLVGVGPHVIDISGFNIRRQ